MPRVLLAFAIIAVVLFAGGAAISAQYAASARDTGDETRITNETWQPTEGQVTTLSESNRANDVYSEQSGVNVRQNGTTIVADGNWTWYSSNGTIKTLNGTSMNTSETAVIDYSYYDPTQTQTLLVNIGTVPIRLGGELLILLVFAVVVLAVVGVAGGGL